MKKEDFNHYLDRTSERPALPPAPRPDRSARGTSLLTRGAAIERDNLPTNWVLAKIDLKNDFNLVSREH